jgi:agmatinase
MRTFPKCKPTRGWPLELQFADLSLLQPAYDTNAEHTTMAAADALYEIMSIMVKKGPLSLSSTGEDEL